MFQELDFRSHVPIYTQLVERIKHMIASGALEPGDQLPTVRQMAAELRVNFNTIARAYRILDEEGVISTQQGRGTYVLEPLPPERASRLRRARTNSQARHPGNGRTHSGDRHGLLDHVQCRRRPKTPRATGKGPAEILRHGRGRSVCWES